MVSLFEILLSVSSFCEFIGESFSYEKCQVSVFFLIWVELLGVCFTVGGGVFDPLSKTRLHYARSLKFGM